MKTFTQSIIKKKKVNIIPVWHCNNVNKRTKEQISKISIN